LPDPIAKKLEVLAQKAMASKAVTDRLAPQNFEAQTLLGESFATFIAQELTGYARIVKDARITTE